MVTTSEELAQILELHKLWLLGRPGGKQANLSGMDLSGVCLSRAKLFNSILQHTKLCNSDLSYADLRRSDLRYANLNHANLRYIDLSDASLRWANLQNADLKIAILDADLYGADLRGAKNVPSIAVARTSIVPESGSFVGWKKCYGGFLVKVQIPAGARRSNATGRLCRAERVKVLKIFGDDVALSRYDGKTEYRVGKIVECDHWDEDRWNECSGGIHFYLTREEAEVRVIPLVRTPVSFRLGDKD
jgi:hypothetical protein